MEALHQLINKNAELVQNQQSGFLQPTIFSPQTKQEVETYTRSEQTQSLSQSGEISKWKPWKPSRHPSSKGSGSPQ